MSAFNKLPGFVKTPPGQERSVLRKLPKVLIVGSLLLSLPSLLARLFIDEGSTTEMARLITSIDIYAISLVILHWTVVFTVGIAAFIIMVMKGPAYVADAYPLQDYDEPDDIDKIPASRRR